MAYVGFDVRPGTAEGSASFYREIPAARADLIDDGSGRRARIMVGARQYFVFRETDAPEQAYDGHHVQIDVADFSGPHRRLQELGLVTEESSQHQYRFRDIVDLDTRSVLFTIEHEVRSMQHPMYARVLVNRDPAHAGTRATGPAATPCCVAVERAALFLESLPKRIAALGKLKE